MNYSILAMQNLVSNCEFVWGFPYNYEDINWIDTRPIPNKKEWQIEKDRLIAQQPLNDCKIKAKQLLSDSDWSEIPSVIEQLENANEWKSYRIEIRKFIINPIENPIFPNKPETLWKVI